MRWLKVVCVATAFAWIGGAGQASTMPGREGFCSALDRFASAGPRGLERQVYFFWPLDGPSEDGSIAIHFYAAMAARPMDDAARELGAAYTRATHYIPLEKFKLSLDDCRSARRGWVKIEASAAACDNFQSTQPCLSIRRQAKP